MYRILHVRLDNFRGKKNFRLSLPDDNVSIIHGTNGSGKTTLLKVIHGILSMNESILQDEDISSASIILKETATNTKKYFSMDFSEEFDDFYITTDIEDIDDFEEEFSSLVFGVNRGITFNGAQSNLFPVDIARTFKEFNLTFEEEVNKGNRPTLNDIANYLNQQSNLRLKRNQKARLDIDLEDNHLMLDNLSMTHVEALLNKKYFVDKRDMSERVQNALFHTLAQVLDNKETNKLNEIDPEEFNKKLSAHNENLLELLSDLKENEISNKIIHLLSNYNMEDKNLFEGKELISNLLYNMVTELEKGQGVLNTVSRLVEEFNDFLEPGKKLIVDERGARVETEISSHGIEKLSSGERHLLSFLTLFIIEGSSRDILMIDEPEISLNLEWQSKLLPMLTKFAPKCQIIVATHSPAIAEFNTGNLVRVK
ncbi:ATP-binding protein [Lysinibacillus fusiformis]|uniref:ATP-binding protein n=1 Tax=Lysinibacillus fusiformis TaxID=28031 RepID=UPI0021BFDDB3|nr:ATP-binding protein [Lysinibacillus fusiformis]UXJ70791.1 ATP-binding protein [Lysinibacillus fusiformis]